MMKLQSHGIWKLAVVASLAAMMSLPALGATEGHGKAVVTVTNKHDKGVPITVPEKDLMLKVDGRKATIDHWAPATDPMQVVLLIDNSARGSLGTQLRDMREFIRSLPASAEVGVAYMQNGRAVFASPLTADKEAAVKGVRLPGGTPGGSGSPYFCLSDLAQHWPSHDMNARREVVMITDGVDNYHPRFDPNDPYVQAAIRDSVKAGLVVYSIYWSTTGSGSMLGATAGQSLLLQVSQATGGEAYWQGFSNPVSFQPFFKEMKQAFGEQYNLEFHAPLRGKKAYEAPMRLKASTPGAKVKGPHRVWLAPPGENEAQ